LLRRSLSLTDVIRGTRRGRGRLRAGAARPSGSADVRRVP